MKETETCNNGRTNFDCILFLKRSKGNSISVGVAIGAAGVGGALHHERIEYDLDDEDVEWLRTLNTQQALEHKPSLSEDDYERLMDRFERDYAVIEKGKMEESLEDGNVETLGNSFLSLSFLRLFQMTLFFVMCNAAVCGVCRDGESEDTNEMLYCEKCNNAVHQACYGVKSIPEGNWMCQTCLLGLSRVSCVLCTNNELGEYFSLPLFIYLE